MAREPSAVGTAVLVHGLWSGPADWRWVRDGLETVGVGVVAPDLPSHSSSSSGLLADARAVAERLRSCAPPVVLVGCSYGGRVISVAAQGVSSVVGLVYVAAVPQAEDDGGDASWVHDDPNIVVRPDGTHCLDTRWWLEDSGDMDGMPAAVVQHLRDHPRRPTSPATDTDPQRVAAWRDLPTTVLVGGDDPMLSEHGRAQAWRASADVRVVEGDHFLIFTRPDLIVDAVVQHLGRAAAAVV